VLGSIHAMAVWAVIDTARASTEALATAKATRAATRLRVEERELEAGGLS
jgi:hypothetical protein